MPVRILLAFRNHLRICSAELLKALAALGAVGIEDIPMENDCASGSRRDVSCEN